MPDWTDVGALDEFPDGVMQVVHLGRREACVLRLGKDLHAFINRCPHAGAKLCAGRVLSVLGGQPGDPQVDTERRVITCPWHGWEFEPGKGNALADTSMRIRTWPARAVDGRVQVSA
jgi:nitrite reductase/ring-hydroxylating ferredoxin subunit